LPAPVTSTGAATEARDASAGFDPEPPQCIGQPGDALAEGGAITGELRLREHTDELYGAIMSYEGRPSDYQMTYIDTLSRELGDVQKSFADFQTGDLARTNAALKAKNLKEIAIPATTPEQDGESGGGKEGLEAAMQGLERD